MQVKVCLPRAKWLVAIPVVALLAGCGGAGTSSNIYPTVSSTTPVNAQSSVPVNSKYAAYFNMQMNTSSFSTTNVTLTPSGGSAITGTVSALGNAVVFAPSNNLNANTVYTATIYSGVTSTTGTALQTNYRWTFTTVPQPIIGSSTDLTPPTVTAHTPLSGAAGVASTTTITATFSKAMNPTTITSSTFTVTGQGNIPVAGTVSGTGAVATFVPSSPLAAGTQFTATVTTGVQDLEGNSMTSNYSWVFNT